MDEDFDSAAGDVLSGGTVSRVRTPFQHLMPIVSIYRHYRIMLAARRLTVDTALLGRTSEDEEPFDFARNASIVFARLPSGYCESSRYLGRLWLIAALQLHSW